APPPRAGPAAGGPASARSVPPTSPLSRSSATWWGDDEPEGFGRRGPGNPEGVPRWIGQLFQGGGPWRKTLRVLTFSLGQLLAGRRLIIIGLLVALPLVLPAVFANGADVERATFTLEVFRQLRLA